MALSKEFEMIVRSDLRFNLRHSSNIYIYVCVCMA